MTLLVMRFTARFLAIAVLPFVLFVPLVLDLALFTYTFTRIRHTIQS
jgi:hypothetical protein